MKRTKSRNPFTRMVSVYYYLHEYHKEHYGSFRDYILNLPSELNDPVLLRGSHLISQIHYTHIEGKQCVDFIGKYEKIDDAAAIICERLGINATLPKINILKNTSRPEGKGLELYDDEMISVMQEVYKEDFEIFGYVNVPEKDQIVANRKRTNTDTKLVEALQLRQSGDYSQAEALYFEVLAIDGLPLVTQAYVNEDLGHLYALMNDSERAYARFERAVELSPDDLRVYPYWLTHCQRLGRYDTMIKLADRLIDSEPQNAQHHLARGNALVCLERAEEAISEFEMAHALDPKNYYVLNAWVNQLSMLNRNDEAIVLGQMALDLKHLEACETFNTSEFKDYRLNPVEKPFVSHPRTRNVIAFSLWGNLEIYTHGALVNAAIAPYIYPEWICRFYCDSSVPSDVIAELKGLDAEVVMMDDNVLWSGTFWRFLPASDPNIDRFLCRDVDSRLNVRERVAVEEWIASGKRFHIMRDHIFHTELMLAGTWGGVAGALPEMRELYGLHHVRINAAHADQFFLKDVIWPIIKRDVLIHDSIYHFEETRDYPTYGNILPTDHVGGGFSTNIPWFGYKPKL